MKNVQGRNKYVIENPALASLKAVKNERVYSIALGDMYCSGIRTIDGINTLQMDYMQMRISSLKSPV